MWGKLSCGIGSTSLEKAIGARSTKQFVIKCLDFKREDRPEPNPVQCCRKFSWEKCHGLDWFRRQGVLWSDGSEVDAIREVLYLPRRRRDMNKSQAHWRQSMPREPWSSVEEGSKKLEFLKVVQQKQPLQVPDMSSEVQRFQALVAAETDLSQTDFGQKNLTDFGQPQLTNFGQK